MQCPPEAHVFHVCVFCLADVSSDDRCMMWQKRRLQNRSCDLVDVPHLNPYLLEMNHLHFTFMQGVRAGDIKEPSLHLRCRVTPLSTVCPPASPRSMRFMRVRCEEWRTNPSDELFSTKLRCRRCFLDSKLHAFINRVAAAVRSWTRSASFSLHFSRTAENEYDFVEEFSTKHPKLVSRQQNIIFVRFIYLLSFHKLSGKCQKVSIKAKCWPDIQQKLLLSDQRWSTEVDPFPSLRIRRTRTCLTKPIHPQSGHMFWVSRASDFWSNTNAIYRKSKFGLLQLALVLDQASITNFLWSSRVTAPSKLKSSPPRLRQADMHQKKVLGKVKGWKTRLATCCTKEAKNRRADPCALYDHLILPARDLVIRGASAVINRGKWMRYAFHLLRCWRLLSYSSHLCHFQLISSQIWPITHKVPLRRQHEFQFAQNCTFSHFPCQMHSCVCISDFVQHCASYQMQRHKSEQRETQDADGCQCSSGLWSHQVTSSSGGADLLSSPVEARKVDPQSRRKKKLICRHYEKIEFENSTEPCMGCWIEIFSAYMEGNKRILESMSVWKFEFKSPSGLSTDWLRVKD